ncbi:MAG: hypothetical protein ABW104_18985 [Candidatus Thiodiazotropha sp. 6PLUC2]
MPDWIIFGKLLMGVRFVCAACYAGLTRFRLVCIALGLHTSLPAQQQKEGLPGGLLPEPGRKAVEAGGFSHKSRGLNRKRQEGRIFQACPGSSFLP